MTKLGKKALLFLHFLQSSIFWTLLSLVVYPTQKSLLHSFLEHSVLYIVVIVPPLTLSSTSLQVYTTSRTIEGSG
jgi:hypothetical protein